MPEREGEQTRQISRAFYWRIAAGSALLVAILFGMAAIFRMGTGKDAYLREAVFGFLFTGLVWWYNLSGFPELERWFFPQWSYRAKAMTRSLSTFLFSFGIVWLDERMQLLQIDATLERYAYPEYSNEFRAILVSAAVLLLVFLLDTVQRFYQTRWENTRLQHENSVAQLAMLKQQINPHFLFNSFNILKTLVKNREPKAEEYIVRLSELYRGLLATSHREKVPLGEELEALDHYLFMLKARFEDKLRFIRQLSPADMSGFVPPFTLQMLVENAIKHNVVSHDKPLTVELFAEKGMLVVRNNLQLRRSTDEGVHIGLANINQRYRLLTGQDIAIEITPDHFIVRLPVISKP